MASAESECARLLASYTQTPIAQLNPDLPDQASRILRGEVTITWPYNGVNNTFAFLLAEPDVRLRRARGQVRVELHCTAAKTVADSGLGGGDEVVLSLDGAEWAKDESTGRIPGTRVDWQLQFSDRLTLQVKLGESSELTLINIDHPQPEAPIAPAPEPQPPVIQPELPVSPEVPVFRKVTDLALEEYPSPAFIKRARLSYGALFEGGFDIFEEDGGVKGKGRKRSRFGRDSNAWRYTSQSPSPDPASPVQDVMEDDQIEEPRPSSDARPQMMDEGFQTVEPQVTFPGADSASRDAISSLQRNEDSIPINPFAKPILSAGKDETSFNPSSAPIGAGSGGNQALLSSSNPPAAVEERQHTLFGDPKQANPAFSMFGAGKPVVPESGPNYTEQVRFGLSHVPHVPQPPANSHTRVFGQTGYQRASEYPETYLETPGPAKYANTSYVDVADGHIEMRPVDNVDMMAEPPAIEEFRQGRWDVATQPAHGNQVEGGHFGADALNEGHRIAAGDAELHSDPMSQHRVPEGFSSYGGDLGAAGTESEIEEPPSVHRGQSDEEEVTQSDEIYGPSEGEDDAEYGEDGRLEEGDYDQRNYNVPADDDEGLSDEDEEIGEAEERYGEMDIYDEDEEDGYGEDWEEDEDESEDDDDDHWQRPPTQPQRAPAAQPAAPVFISLLSDSEDDDEPAPAPTNPPAVRNAAKQLPAPVLASPEVKHENSAKSIDPVPLSSPVASAVEPSNDASAHTGSPSRAQVQALDFAASPSSADHQRSDAGAIEVVDSSSSDEESDNESLQPSDEEGSDSEGEASESGIPTQKQDASMDSQEESDELDGSSSADEEMHDNGFPPDAAHPNTIKDKSENEVEDEEPTSGVIVSKNMQDLVSDSMEVGEERQTALTQDEELEANDEDNAMDKAEFPSILEGQVEKTAAAPQEDAEMINPAPLATEANTENDRLPLSSESESAPKPVEAQSGQSPEQPSSNKPEVPAPGSAAINTDIGPAPVSVLKHHDTANIESAAFDNPHLSTQKANGSATFPSSPPLTQSFESRVSRNHMPRLFSPATSRPTSKEGAPPRQLPTPMGSQLTADMVSQGALAEEYEMIEVSIPTTVKHQLHVSHSFVEVETSFQSLPQPESDGADELANGHSTANDETAPIKFQDTKDVAEDVEDARAPTKPFDTIVYTQIDGSVPSKPQTDADRDESFVDDNTTVLSPSASVGAGIASEVKEQSSPRIETRSAKKRRHAAEKELSGDNITAQTRRTRSSDASALRQRTDELSPDPSVSLARHAIAVKRPKKAPEPVRTSPIVTRARSNSLQMSATPEGEDASIYLAQASLASPSKTRRSLHSRTTSLQSEITKLLGSQHDCLPLNLIDDHFEELLNVVAVATTQPPDPVRAKKGPREYLLGFNITDASTAPSRVIAVQIYRPHKEAMPVINPGDVIYLQNFQVKAMTNKRFGLCSQAESSAWAVFDADGEPPQIKGPPVEDWKQYREYAGLLRAWYQSMDEAGKAELDRANKKFESAQEGK